MKVGVVNGPSAISYRSVSLPYFRLHPSHFSDRNARGVNPLKQLVPSPARRAADFTSSGVAKLPHVVNHAEMAVGRAVEFEHQLPTQATILPPPNDLVHISHLQSLSLKALDTRSNFINIPKFGCPERVSNLQFTVSNSAATSGAAKASHPSWPSNAAHSSSEPSRVGSAWWSMGLLRAG